ncbi:glycolate oxidase subunit GlcE [Noviherbaspirillum saxi]|uniref:Glycolate oxidase subunit GlcE n=1 Tax=Noviherbaspirillum saxi TaxID=2320863 RepID=A0A3A3FTK7_9BURK|nr:glycolate oxidase subunit GlcE [Noviherbaspirillum saxi]RJF99557.1 glycolate oxidase subunit GlcE [Noviherbaspirillum saxi]
MEQVLQQFRDSIASATAAGTALRIRGGGTKDWYGQALDGHILDTRAYAGIVAYDPTELVITARAGTPLSEIEAALAQHNQMLAFEPPRYGAASTIGGIVAAGLSGPRRQAVGAVRDFVLGAVLMDAKGEVLHFGGQVMKNVAGYDVSRLLAGSLGTLGLILEVSLKVLPKPFAETTLRFDMNKAEAIERLNNWGGQPLPLSASAWHGGVLIVRLSGAEAALRSAVQKMGGEEETQADMFWEGLRNQDNDYFAAITGPTALWRLSLPSTAVPLTLHGEHLVEWGGAQRWLRTEIDADSIRAAAEQAGGHATLFRGGDKGIGVFHPLAPAVAKIHRHLKNAFDPSGIFNPGRMYTGF